jgi:hypothetical protein
MPRIAREEQMTIRHRIEVDKQKVAEVAAAYGCTPANIYAILARLRRQEAPKAGQAVAAASVAEAEATDAASADLLSGLAATPPQPATPVVPPAAEPEQPAMATAGPSVSPVTASAPSPAQAGRTVTAPRPPKPAPTPRAGKPGYGLLMRASDGEEAIHPFRSLDELLSAAKPILRAAARSPEPIWFSIQQVDIEALEDSI